MKSKVTRCRTHGDLSEEECNKAGMRKDKQRYRCKICYQKIMKKYIEENKEAHLQHKLDWARNNKEKVKVSARKTLLKNRDKYRENRRKNQSIYRKRHPEIKRIQFNRCVEKANDYYISLLLRRGSQIKSKDIPQSLIEAKRASLLLRRKIKEKENEVSS